MTIDKTSPPASAGAGGGTKPAHPETGKLGLAREVKPIEKSGKPAQQAAAKVEKEFLVVEEQLQNAPDQIVVAKPLPPLPMTHAAPAPELGKWAGQDIKMMAPQREAIAKKYLESAPHHDAGKMLEFLKNNGLKEFLVLNAPNPAIKAHIEQHFDTAVKNRDLPTFLTFLKHLTFDGLRLINKWEHLEALTFPETSHAEITVTHEHIRQLQQFIEDKGFSGVVSISDRGGRTYTLRSKKINNSNLEGTDIPFSMHSVAKMFTGVLAIQLIRNELINKNLLDQPVRFEHSVAAKIPENIRNHIALNNITLRELMLHQAGLKEYIPNYEKALALPGAQPQINSPHDLVPFIETDTLEPGKEEYSNAGMLLAGLALEHYYNEAHPAQKKSFEELLQEQIIAPANMQPLVAKSPPKTCYNHSDPTSEKLRGGPAGGYFTTVDNLRTFGEWVNKRCDDEAFFAFLKDCGGEFYSKDEHELSHPGDMKAASAYLTSYRSNGVTLAILSDQGHNAASMLYGDIHRHLLSKKVDGS